MYVIGGSSDGRVISICNCCFVVDMHKSNCRDSDNLVMKTCKVQCILLKLLSMKDCSVIDYFIHYSNWYILFWCPQNMVGPGEVDEDLQPEVTEECTKYGEVSNCLVYEIRPQCMYDPLSPPTRLQSRKT